MPKIIKYILCIVVVLFAFSASGIGDVGDFNDYDSGSSWSDSSSSSGWDSDSSSNWSSGSSSRRSHRSYDPDSDEHEHSFMSDLLLVVIVMVFVGVMGLIKQSKQSGNVNHRTLVKWPDVPDHTDEITRALQQEDPSFNKTAFLEWAKEVFFKLQTAWMERDWEQVRPFESEELYATHERQLQEYKRLGRINVLERINVNNAYFFSLVKDNEWETLSVVMHVRMIDYIIDEHTRKVLKGSADDDCFMSYFYTFKRKAGVKTMNAKQEVGTIACPNCGAPTHVVSSGKCEFCNFVITVKDHGWVLSDIAGIKPPYNYGSGGVINR